MQTITTIGFDIAKSVFHGIEAVGNVLVRRCHSIIECGLLTGT
jgi:hypothetical protein